MLKIIRSQLNAILDDEGAHSYRYYSIHLKAIQQQFVCIQNLHHQIWESMETTDPAMYNYDALSAAPYRAIRTLRALADEYQKRYPLAAIAFRKNFYIDDVLAGYDKLSMTLEMQKQLRNMMGSAGFKLRKWCSNHPKLLCDIPREDQELTLNFNEKCFENIKTLGLNWRPTKDDFVLKVGKIENNKITKRTVLSDTAHIFDPLGFVSPVTAMAKIFLQKLWQLKLDWDAALPQDLHVTWSKFREELPLLQNLHIPRSTASPYFC